MRCKYIIIVAFFISLTPVLANAEWHYYPEEDDWSEGELCSDILKYLNKYDMKNADCDCAWGIVASYPGFKEPPWKDLDPKKHADLIFKILKYGLCGTDGVVEKGRCQPDSYFRRESQWFIDDGGRLQVWRTKGLMNEDMRGPHSPKMQTVIQLRWKRNLKKEAESCPGMPVVDWWLGGLYIVADDLSVPKIINEYHAKAKRDLLMSMTVFYFKNELYYISSGWDEIVFYKDYDGDPGLLCDLRYKGR